MPIVINANRLVGGIIQIVTATPTPTPSGHSETRVIYTNGSANYDIVGQITSSNPPHELEVYDSGIGYIAQVDIGNTVTSIGNEAFYYCTYLTNVTIPASVTSIGNSAFYGCSSLTSVTITDGLTSIGDNAFNECSYLSSVTIPDSVTSIGDNAFWYGGLTYISIGSGIETIGTNAFLTNNYIEVFLIDKPTSWVSSRCGDWGLQNGQLIQCSDGVVEVGAGDYSPGGGGDYSYDYSPGAGDYSYGGGDYSSGVGDYSYGGGDYSYSGDYSYL